MSKEFIIKHGAKINEGGTLTIGDPNTTGYSLPNTAGNPGEVLEVGPGGTLAFAPVSTSSVTVERLRINYNSFGQILNVTDTTSGIFSTTIVGGTNLDTHFTGYLFPPSSIMTYGYNSTSDVYLVNTVQSAFGTRQIDSLSGTLFGNMTTAVRLRLTLDTGNTGALNSQHAWVVFTMYG